MSHRVVRLSGSLGAEVHDLPLAEAGPEEGRNDPGLCCWTIRSSSFPTSTWTWPSTSPSAGTSASWRGTRT